MSLDVWSEPEAFGLEIVADFDGGVAYEFDMVVVWKDRSGNLYWAADAGCSCPSPFEDYSSIESLTPLKTQRDIAKLETNRVLESGELADWTEFIQQVHGLMRNK